MRPAWGIADEVSTNYAGLAVSLLGRLITSTTDKTGKEETARKISEYIAGNYLFCEESGDRVNNAFLTGNVVKHGKVELNYEEIESPDEASAA